MNLVELCTTKGSGQNMHWMSMLSGVSYTTIHAHVRYGKRLTVETAERLAAVDPRLSVAEILGIEPAPAKRRTKAA